MEAAVDFAVKRLGYSSLKKEQLEIVMTVLRGGDMFGILPMGHREDFMFCFPPFLFLSKF